MANVQQQHKDIFGESDSDDDDAGAGAGGAGDQDLEKLFDLGSHPRARSRTRSARSGPHISPAARRRRLVCPLVSPSLAL